MAVVLARTGTLGASRGIVMADEAMAIGVAKGLIAASDGHLSRCDVLAYDEVPSARYDSVFLMHHAVSPGLHRSLSDLPRWLWVHNPGPHPACDGRLCSTAVDLVRSATTTYQRVFHAGWRMADACLLDYLPHGLEDPDMFIPDRSGDAHDVAFVGNAEMHVDVAPLLGRLVADGRKTEIRGTRWRELGVASQGPIPMAEAGGVIARSSVCLDHVSRAHAAEGMSSTRIYQVLACESALVSMQDPANVPEEMRKHVVFARDAEDAYVAINRLLSDPVARARLRTGARASVVNHTMARRAKTVWSRISSDCDGESTP